MNAESRRKYSLPLSFSLFLMPLDFELTRLDSSPPPELRAGASVTVDTSAGRVSLGGVVFATLSAEDIAKVSSSSSSLSSSFSNPSSATVRTIRRDKDSISSVTIRLVAPDTQARQQHQQQPRRGKFCLANVFPFFKRSIDGEFFSFSLVEKKISTSTSTATSTSSALGPPPSSTLDPDELACRLTKAQLDALASSPEVLEALRDESTRAAVTRVLAAADNNSSASSAAAALESEGAPLAGLATAVLDCLEEHAEADEKKK